MYARFEGFQAFEEGGASRAERLMGSVANPPPICRVLQEGVQAQAGRSRCALLMSREHISITKRGGRQLKFNGVGLTSYCPSRDQLRFFRPFHLHNARSGRVFPEPLSGACGKLTSELLPILRGSFHRPTLIPQ
jgi:hypothetical protein